MTRAEIRLYEWLFHVCVAAPSAAESSAAPADDKAAEEAAKAALRKAAAARAEANLDAEESDDENDEVLDSKTESRDPIDSETVLANALVETSVGRTPGTHYQFERLGYFVIDKDTTDDKLVINRAVTLKESSVKRKMK